MVNGYWNFKSILAGALAFCKTYLVGGIIESIIPSEYVSKYLGGAGFKTLLWSTVFGFLMSACSHGILSIAVALFRKGSTTAATLTFLLAAPWANPAITILLIVLFKGKAFLLIGGALIIALISGLIFQYLEKRGVIEQGHPIEVGEDFSLWQDIKKRFRKRKKSFKVIVKNDLVLDFNRSFCRQFNFSLCASPYFASIFWSGSNGNVSDFGGGYYY